MTLTNRPVDVWLVLDGSWTLGQRLHWVTLADQSLMRLVITRCTVDYSGRLTAHLPEATRLIMVKADGTLAIHSDGNASKPLNW